jgi:poly(hydroxyalkanoate) depolymerase family esterase
VGIDAGKPHMLVVLLHGCTQDAADIARGTRLTSHADRDGFIALLPEQPASANAKKCWNWYDPAHQARDGGEPSIIAGLTAKIMSDYRVDPDRVHLAGISAGAAMASLIAVAYPETYASVALHSGIPWHSATDVMAALGVMAKGLPDDDARTLGAQAATAMGKSARPIPALVIYGGSDKVVNTANGRGSVILWAAMNRAATGAPPAAVLTPTASSGIENEYHFQRASYEAGRREVVEIRVEELGHAWSGGAADGTFTDVHGVDAMAEVLRFFARHPRNEPR